MKTLEINHNIMERTELSAALHAKCPRCRTGAMFTNSMYGFRQQKMNVDCPHCHLKYEREPGYFYVAMFVSYAMNVIEMLLVGYSTYLITGNTESPYLYMIVIFAGILLLSPFNYRFSRIILLYWLTPGLHFDPERAKKKAGNA
jgi:uncharacterized protein (DUF983 family)